MSNEQIQYKHLYFYLFNCMTDALEKLERGQFGVAELILQSAQQESETMWINAEQEKEK